LARYGRFIKQCGTVVAVVTNAKAAPKWYLHDSSMAAHHMCQMAWALGVGTCWIGTLDRDAAGALLDLGPDEHLTTILPLGYPAQDGIEAPERKPLAELVSRLD
jgi:nitroreductase